VEAAQNGDIYGNLRTVVSTFLHPKQFNVVQEAVESVHHAPWDSNDVGKQIVEASQGDLIQNVVDRLGQKLSSEKVGEFIAAVQAAKIEKNQPAVALRSPLRIP